MPAGMRTATALATSELMLYVYRVRSSSERFTEILSHGDLSITPVASGKVFMCDMAGWRSRR